MENLVPPSSSSHIAMALASIQCFTDDGVLDVEEVNFLLGMALADGHVDAEEKRVLHNIFSKISQAEVSEKTWQRIEEVKRKHPL